MITKTERNELKSLVKQQFRVLRAEVRQREAEMLSEAETKIWDRFKGLDEARARANESVTDVIDEANRKLRDLAREHDEACGGIHGIREFGIPFQGSFAFNPDRRVEMHRALASEIEAQVRGALLNLDRQEADLLRRLAIGALESEEAQAFLNQIPDVGELVPAARMQELERALDDEALVEEPDRD